MTTRRKFLKIAGAIGGLSVLPAGFHDFPKSINLNKKNKSNPNQSVIGLYGPWAAGLNAMNPKELSFRNNKWNNIGIWHETASKKIGELISKPVIQIEPLITIKKIYNYNDLEIEEISWELPYGRPVEAVVLKPADAKGKLPAILALHDHGGMKYFGYRKITRTSDQVHPMIADHQKNDYGGFAWANEIARRGYVVLVHDAFAFGSRRVLYQDVNGIDWGFLNVSDKSDNNPEDPGNISVYNEWASQHESVMAKSLFCGGTTWPGVFLAEDQIALDILSKRKDVDPARIGCGGLSGGGLRTVYLAGTDPRIKCAVCVGFMTTWNDFLLNKSYTHTWMTYTPLLPKFMEFPEILALRIPLPTMVQNNMEDPLYTMPEMIKANEILKEIYEKAGASEHYQGKFYPGVHKFDGPMQIDAFNWLDRWLKT